MTLTAFFVLAVAIPLSLAAGYMICLYKMAKDPDGEWSKGYACGWWDRADWDTAWDELTTQPYGQACRCRQGVVRDRGQLPS